MVVIKFHLSDLGGPVEAPPTEAFEDPAHCSLCEFVAEMRAEHLRAEERERDQRDLDRMEDDDE